MNIGGINLGKIGSGFKPEKFQPAEGTESMGTYRVLVGPKGNRYYGIDGGFSCYKPGGWFVGDAFTYVLAVNETRELYIRNWDNNANLKLSINRSGTLTVENPGSEGTNKIAFPGAVLKTEIDEVNEKLKELEEKGLPIKDIYINGEEIIVNPQRMPKYITTILPEGI